MANTISDTRQKTAHELLTAEFEARRKKNSRYSMRSFARSLGLSQTQLSLILSGKREVSLPQALRLAQVLSPDFTTVEKLLGVSLIELAQSKKLITIPNLDSSPTQIETDEGRIENLLRGIVVRSPEWPSYQSLVDQILRDAPSNAMICLALKVFDENGTL
jgi:transcriptional regulator with XRE-family HTH domain